VVAGTVATETQKTVTTIIATATQKVTATIIATATQKVAATIIATATKKAVTVIIATATKKAVTVIIATTFFFENAQILLSSAALLKTKFEGVWMFLRKEVFEVLILICFKSEASFS